MAAPGDFEYYGRVAFEAYKLECRGLTHDGSEIPEWEQLGETVQLAWIAAGKASVNAYLGE